MDCFEYEGGKRYEGVVRIDKTSYDIYMAEINSLQPRKRKQWKEYLYDKWGGRTRCKYEDGKIMNWSLLENEWVKVVPERDSYHNINPTSRLGQMLKDGVPRQVAFELEVALNKLFDQETTGEMNKAAAEHDPNAQEF